MIRLIDAGDFSRIRYQKNNMENYLYYVLYVLMLGLSVHGIYAVTRRNNQRSKSVHFNAPMQLPEHTPTAGMSFIFEGSWSSLRLQLIWTSTFCLGLFGLVSMTGFTYANLLFLYFAPFVLLELFKSVYALFTKVRIADGHLQFLHLIRKTKDISLPEVSDIEVKWTYFRTTRTFDFYPTFIFNGQNGAQQASLPGRHFPGEVPKILAVLMLLYPEKKYSMRWDQYSTVSTEKSKSIQDHMELRPVAHEGNNASA